MPRYNNVRFQNMVSLIDVSRMKSLRPVMISDLDHKHQTTYYSDLFYQSDWPDYVRLYGLTDPFSDMVADHTFDQEEDDVFHQLETIGSKLSDDGSQPPFTPTRDPDWRAALELDRFESGWFRNLRKVSLPKQLCKAGWQALPAWRMTEAAQSNLAYALYAARVPAMARISAFCLGEVFRLEIEAKLIKAMEKARSYNVAFATDADGRDRQPCLYGLLDWLNRQPVPGSVPAFYEWSHGQDRTVLASSQSEHMFAMVHSYLGKVHNQEWPDREHMARLAEFLFDGKKPGLFLSLMHNASA